MSKDTDWLRKSKEEWGKSPIRETKLKTLVDPVKMNLAISFAYSFQWIFFITQMYFRLHHFRKHHLAILSQKPW